MPLGLYLSHKREVLLLLMTILSQSFFPFVCRHLMSFSYFFTLSLTSLTKLLEGLNDGML